ncbi:MAG: hypothetical protein LIO45_02285, partial [Clostridiales bacterium]|nr:hypothetical protein [Clostridiales bacterium]
CVLAIAYNLLGYQLDGAALAALSYDTALNNMVTAVGASLGYSDWSYRKLLPLRPEWVDTFLTSQGISHTYYSSDDLPSDSTITAALKNGKIVMMSVSGDPYSTNIHWILAYGVSKDGNTIYIDCKSWLWLLQHRGAVSRWRLFGQPGTVPYADRWENIYRRGCHQRHDHIEFIHSQAPL